MGPDIAYIDDKPFNPITLDIRLSPHAECVLYDDNERARTQEIVKCQASKKGSQISLNVGPSAKTFIAKFNKIPRPKHVTLNGKAIPHLPTQDALEKAPQGWHFDPAQVVYAKFGPSENATELLLR
jgi:hypothetical protein